MDGNPISECQNKGTSETDMDGKSLPPHAPQPCSPEVTKRKKDFENSTSATNKLTYEWHQTLEDLTIIFPTEDKKTDALAKDWDVELTDTGIMVRFPDGRLWAKTLYKEINRDKSKVFIKKQKLNLHVHKKIPGIWEHFEETNSDVPEARVFTSAASATSVEHSVSSESTTMSSVDDPTEAAMSSSTQLPNVPVSSSTQLPNVPVSSSTLLPDVPMSSSTQLPDIPVSSSTSIFPESPGHSTSLHKEESLGGKENEYLLQHTKHDYIEKDDLFCLHIYLKEVARDNVEVTFTDQSICVKFKTRDAKYHSLHTGTNEDTMFCWKINLKDKIDPGQSKFKITKTMIEVQLAKKLPGRWATLESPQRKEKVETSKSDSWIPTNRSKDVSLEDVTNVSAQRENAKGSTESLPPDQRDGTSQKPTCKVSPMNKTMTELAQALANTREFRDFFLDGQFQQEINTSNSLGTGGKLVVSFAVLLKVLWSGKHYSYAPSKLKNLIALKASQFTGFAQHDAQEFMAFLLDGLHEDLNRIKKKPYTETVDSDGRPDEVVANMAWEMYLKRDDSFIVDLFQGQYKSKLVCPVCSKVSITFDPFLYLSVPMPKKLRCVSVIFMWKDPHRKPVKYMLRLPKDARIDQMKESLGRKTGVRPKDMRVFEAYQGKIHKFFSHGSDLSNVQFNDKIIVCEVLSAEVAGENVYEICVIQRTLMPNSHPTKCAACKKLCPLNAKLKRCARCFKVGYCDQQCQKEHWQLHKQNCQKIPESVGYPFILSIPESRATFSRLCSLMEAFARYSIDVFQPPVKPELPKLHSQPSSSSLSNSSQSSGSLNSLDSQSSFSSSCTITGNPEQELEDTERCPSEPCSSGDSLVAQAGSMSSIQTTSSQSSLSSQNLLDTASGGGDSQFSAEESDLDDSAKSFPAASAENLNLAPDSELNNSAHIEQGPDIPLDLTNKMFLSVDWKNDDKLPSYVLVQSKEMDYDDDSSTQTQSYEENELSLDQCLELFTEPEVLSADEAWYCPRYFPIRGLDMSKFYIGRGPSNEPPPIYDLYAVTNHMGGILGGHYTAFVRCADINDHMASEIGWRLCDDNRVSSVSNEKNIVTRAAYLLF
ncbi:hypothetical protein ScPMuIL_008205 [Solemya velum]